jgi:hypothetical protein
LEIIDISDSSSPHRVGGHSTFRNASDCAVSGSHIFVAGEHDGLVVLELQPVLRSISTAGRNLSLRWEGFGPVRLQRATRITDADWEDLEVPAEANHLELPPSESNGFFRLLKLGD